MKRVRLFLDAHVLISAAWKDASKVTRVWSIPAVDLVTSNLVLAECERNLSHAPQLERLVRLLQSVRVLEFDRAPVLDLQVALPEKGHHVLAAAVLTRTDFLVTGDRNHFGLWYGSSVLGIRVEPPGSVPAVLAERG